MDKTKLSCSDSYKNNLLVISSLMPEELWQISMGFLPHVILQDAEDQKTGLQELRYVCRTFKQLAEQDPRWRLAKYVRTHASSSALPIDLVCDRTLIALFDSVTYRRHFKRNSMLNLTGSENFGAQALVRLPKYIQELVLTNCLQLKPTALSAIRRSGIERLDLQGLHLTKVWAQNLPPRSTTKFPMGITITGPRTETDFLAALPSHIYGIEILGVNSIANVVAFFKSLPDHVCRIELDTLTIESAKGLASTHVGGLRIFGQLPSTEALSALKHTVSHLTLDLYGIKLGSILTSIPPSVTGLTLCGYLDQTDARWIPPTIQSLRLMTEPQNAEVLLALGGNLQSVTLEWLHSADNPFVLDAMQELGERDIDVEIQTLDPGYVRSHMKAQNI